LVVVAGFKANEADGGGWGWCNEALLYEFIPPEVKVTPK
jgi:hypothetical protein